MLFAIYVVLMTACLLGAVTAVVELIVKEKKRGFEIPTIVIPLQCVTSDIVLTDCDATLTSCKRVNFKHRHGCEQVKAN
jgi:hypothetical protein